MLKLLRCIGLSFVVFYSSLGYCQVEQYKCYVTYKKNNKYEQTVIELKAWGEKSLKQVLKKTKVYEVDGVTKYPIKKVHECTKLSLAFEGESALEIEKNLPK